MDPGCRKISKEILPAVRASVAQTMIIECNYRQREIAEKLGVVQVSVSKYINKKYSKEISDIVGYIKGNRLEGKVIESIVKGKPISEISAELDSLCEDVANSSYYKKI